MIVERCYDVEVIKALATEPDVYERIREDGWPSSDHYRPDLYNCIYVVGYVNSDPIGMGIACPINNVTCEGHFAVLPKYREQYASELFSKTIEWIFSKEFSKVVVQIPFLYPDVKRFVEKHGFELEGVNRKSVMKNGEIHDQWYLGLVR